MRLILVLCFFLSASNLVAQTSVLTGFKNGSWALLDTNGKVLTNTEYHYIHSFDLRNTSYFMKNGLYGIIDASGKEKLAAEFTDIVQHGFGIYSVRKEDRWQLIRVVDKPEILFDTIPELPEVLGNHWIILNDSINGKLINLQSGKAIPTMKNDVILLNSAEFLGLGHDSLITAFHPSGDELKTIIGSFYTYSDRFLVLIDTNEQRTVIDETGIWNFPFSVTGFSISTGEVYSGNNNYGRLYDLATKKVIFEGPYSRIYTYNDKYFGVDGPTGANLINKTTRKALLPPQLGYFYENEKNFNVYRSNGTTALLDLEGKFVLPGFYDYIHQNGQMLNVSLNSNAGLYSLKKKAFVLPMIYYSIANQQNNRYKALTDEAFTIIELDESHNIKRRIDGSNNVRIRTASSSASKRFFDPRLFPLGWYVDSSEVEVNGEMKIRYSWGLKEPNDSIKMKPKYPDLAYIEGPFSLLVNPPKKITVSNGQVKSVKTYEFVSWENGKKIPNLVCTYIDSNDFRTQTWTKFSTATSGGIIDTEGKIRYFTYLSGVSVPFTRYCEAEAWEASPQVRDTSFYQTTENYDPYEFASNQNRYVAKKGKWNFINPDGSDLFKEPFQFVQEFVGTTAIAKRNGKWGVISKDTILIPFKFNKITRKIIGSDTLFLTDEAPESSRYLTESLQEIPGIRNVIVKSPNLLLVDQKGTQNLMNEKLEVVAENVKSLKVLPSGYLRAKIDKEIQILDSSGFSKATTTFDVVDVLCDKYCLTEKNSRFGLTDFSNHLLLPENHNSITVVGKHLIAKSDLYYLYDENLQLIRKSDHELFVDPITNTVSVTKKSTTTIYKEKQKLVKLKNTIPNKLWNNLIWIDVKEQTFGIDFNGDTVVKSGKIETFTLLPNNWIALKPEKGNWEFYTQNWKKQSTPISSRKFICLEPQFMAFLTKKNHWLIWDETTGNTIEEDAIIGSFENGLCLVKTGKSYFYINQDLKPANNLRYTNASAFHNGLAATCDSRGGTLINTEFKPLTYPSYIGLTYLGANVYKASPQILHNLYRLNGTSILPKGVENLNIINNRFIQTIDKGEVHYTRLSGILMF